MRHKPATTILHTGGYSLIEVLVILLVFTTMFVTMLTVFQSALKWLNYARAKIVATDVATEQIEIVRNLTYANVGTVSGSPVGTLPETQTVTRSNITFTVTISIKNVDDPFDGCVGAPTPPHDPSAWSKCADGTEVNKPQDIPTYNNNPADYKKADVTVTWNSYYSGQPVVLSTIIAPKGLEGNSTNGYLLVKVFDASGVAVDNAAVHITNASLSPAYDHSFTTDAFGNVLLLDMTPAANYVIYISKNGYSSERTCSIDAGGTECSDTTGNPDPVKENVTINQGQYEEISFAIDKVSTLVVNSYNESCTAMPNINFTIQGVKTISEPPSNILKNVITFQTDASGHWTTSALEWDLYDLLVNTSGYDIAGINHDLALNVLPNTSTTLNVLLAPHTTNSLLLTVKDSSGTSLSGATVHLTGTGYDESKPTGQGFAKQTDWSGGSGQADFTDATKYFADNGHIDHSTTSGQLTLHKNSTTLFTSESFDTDTYKDGVATTADWNTDLANQDLRLGTVAGKYPTGVSQYGQSLQMNTQYGKITASTLSVTEDLNGQSANYFLSADGGLHFESVTPGVAHTFVNQGSDLRWRIELSTSDEDTTPRVSELSIDYHIEYFDASGELTSSTFDLGSSATFTTMYWQPGIQPSETGNESIKFQLATSNDPNPATWDFIGPDGTSGTHYSSNNADINDVHNGNRYLRYKVILSTDDTYYTSSLTEINIGYTLACLPPGQAFFNNLSVETYTAEISLTGYQTETQTIDVNGYTTQQIQLNSL